MKRGLWTYLNDREAQDGCSDIADKHARKSGNEHVGDKDSSRFRSCLAEDKGRDTLVDPGFGESSGDSEAT